MAITTFKRYEKKFLLNETQYRNVFSVILQSMNLDENCQDGKGYTIYNIYYDTRDSSIIRHSLSKPYYKEKLRLRSYGIPCSPNSQVFLELKKKIGGIVNKRRAVLTLSEAYNFLATGTRPSNLDYNNQQVLNEISYYLMHHAVEPAACISYDRIALLGREDRDFRITFDHNILTRSQDLNIEKVRYGEDLLPGRYIMEVKVREAFPVWLANLLSENQIYKTSFSKYGNEYTSNLLKQASYCLKKAV